MIRTQIQLSEEQSKKLKKLARQANVSVAEMIRRSVDHYIEAQTGISEDERRKRLLSVIGIGHSGVSDLGSEHDQYLAEIYTRLKKSAEQNRRSLNSEIITILEQALQSRPVEPEALLARARQIREKTAAYPLTEEAFREARDAGRE